jgi:hypothetical protein
LPFIICGFSINTSNLKIKGLKIETLNQMPPVFFMFSIDCFVYGSMSDVVFVVS